MQNNPGHILQSDEQSMIFPRWSRLKPRLSSTCRHLLRELIGEACNFLAINAIGLGHTQSGNCLAMKKPAFPPFRPHLVVSPLVRSQVNSSVTLLETDDPIGNGDILRRSDSPSVAPFLALVEPRAMSNVWPGPFAPCFRRSPPYQSPGRRFAPVPVKVGGRRVAEQEAARTAVSSG